jgi:small subunit ribosomal protein S4
MARNTGPVCKLCRRENQKLFLKGQKCFTDKCPMERRAYPPGQHGPAQARRRKQSDYAVQLREKQKVKRIYGLQEKQFRNLFESAAKVSGITGANLIVALESRLDSIVFRFGFAPSRSAARQLIRHRHIEVDGRIVDVPSFAVKPGQQIAVKAKSKDNLTVQSSLEARTRPALLDWLALDDKARVGRMVRQPTRAEVPLAAQEQLIVELYSK